MHENIKMIVIFSIIILFVVLLFVIKQNSVKMEKFRGGHSSGMRSFSGNRSGMGNFSQGQTRPSGGNFSPRGGASAGYLAGRNRNNWGHHHGHGGHHNWNRYIPYATAGAGLGSLYYRNYPYDYNNLFYDNGYYDNVYADPVYVTQPVIINQVPFERNNVSEEE